MKEKIRTFLWFVSKPYLYPQLIYQFRQSFFPHSKENTRKEATEICKRSAIDHKVLFEKLGIRDVIDFEEAFQVDLKNAKQIEDSIPLKMGGGGDGHLLFNITKQANPEVVVETGVAYGWSSLAILLALEANKKGKLLSTDMPYAKMNNENFVGSVVPDRLRDRWSLFRLPDRQALRKIARLHKEIDIVHYDSDKSYRGRKWAYPFLWNLLKDGGLLVSDDINDNTGFFDFSKQVETEPLVVGYGDKFIGILKK